MTCHRKLGLASVTITLSWYGWSAREVIGSLAGPVDNLGREESGGSEVALTAHQRKRVAWLIDGHLADDYDEATFDARWAREFAALSSPEEMYLFASESHPDQSPLEWRRVLARVQHLRGKICW